MSWRKAALSARVTWIGWAFDFDMFTVELDPAKMVRLLELLRSLSASPRCSVTALEKLTGKLLWLSNVFQAFRPSLAPLYTDQRCPLPNMCAVSAEIYHSLRASLSRDLPPSRLRPFPWAASFSVLLILNLPLCRMSHSMSPLAVSGFKSLIRSARSASSRPSLRRSSPCGCPLPAPLSHSGPSSSARYLSARHLQMHVRARPLLASGGFVRLPDGRQGHDFFPWFPPDTSPQHCIAAWEMLAQVALLWTLCYLLPPGHAPFHVVFRTDNSPSQSAAWKGLTLARGMCQFLRQFCLLQETARISVHLDSVPGFLNDIADAQQGCCANLTGFQTIRSPVRAVDFFLRGP